MGADREDHLKKGSKVTPYEAMVAGSISGGIARYVYLTKL
jgi:hypothetical protein